MPGLKVGLESYSNKKSVVSVTGLHPRLEIFGNDAQVTVENPSTIGKCFFRVHTIVTAG